MTVSFPKSTFGFEVDVSEWPVLVITAPRRVTDEDMKSFTESIGQFLTAKSERYAFVIDTRATENLDMFQRQLHVEFMKKRKEFTDKFCAATALVFDSFLLRGVLLAILWAFKPSYPIRVFKTPKDAIDWAKTQF